MAPTRRTLLATAAVLCFAPRGADAKNDGKGKAAAAGNGSVAIDFVATGKFAGATPGQQRHFLNSFVNSGTRMFESLGAARQRDGAVPPDGNAPYRLSIEFQGKLWVDEPTHTLDEMDIVDTRTRRILQERGGRLVSWELNSGYDGVLRFKLLEWKPNAYCPLRAWEVPYKDRECPDLVTALVTNAPVPGLKLPEGVTRHLVHPGIPPCPLTPAEIAAAKEKALLDLLPGTLSDEITGGLVTCEVVRANIRPTPEDRHVGRNGQELRDILPQGEVVIRLRNHSPWTVASAHVRAAWAGPGRKTHFLTKLLEPANPIPPGKSADVLHRGVVGEGGTAGECRVAKASFSRVPREAGK